jgi:hypothetical protein
VVREQSLHELSRTGALLATTKLSLSEIQSRLSGVEPGLRSVGAAGGDRRFQSGESPFGLADLRGSRTDRRLQADPALPQRHGIRLVEASDSRPARRARVVELLLAPPALDLQGGVVACITMSLEPITGPAVCRTSDL